MKVRNLMIVTMLLALPFAVHGDSTKENQTSKGQRLIEKLRNVNQAYKAKPGKSAEADAPVTGKKVKGTYATEGFSNSIDCDFISSIASIGKLHLGGNGTGVFRFLAITFVSNEECEGETFTFTDLPVTYTLNDPVSGVGMLTIPDFDVTLYVVFFTRCGKVVGFNQLLNNGSPAPPGSSEQVSQEEGFPLWFLGKGIKDS